MVNPYAPPREDPGRQPGKPFPWIEVVFVLVAIGLLALMLMPAVVRT